METEMIECGAERSAHFVVPTHTPDEEEDWDGSRAASVSARYEEGVALFLGERVNDRSTANPDTPTVIVERRTDCWAVMVAPDAGDELCWVYLYDDGRNKIVDSNGNVILEAKWSAK